MKVKKEYQRCPKCNSKQIVWIENIQEDGKVKPVSFCNSCKQKSIKG